MEVQASIQEPLRRKSDFAQGRLVELQLAKTIHHDLHTLLTFTRKGSGQPDPRSSRSSCSGQF